MPFEPLGTDEQLEGPVKKKTDFETRLMGGCMTVLVASFATYIMIAWPWMVFPEYTVGGLIQCGLFGALPALVFGIFVIRRFGSAGLSGWLGGAAVGAVFMYLRLNQGTLREEIRDLPQVEYPASWIVAVPLGWLVLAVLFGIALLPSHEFEPEGGGDSSR